MSDDALKKVKDTEAKAKQIVDDAKVRAEEIIEDAKSQAEVSLSLMTVEKS